MFLALLSVVCPPLAVLLTASPAEAAKNLGLTLLFYVPGLLHAQSVVERYQVNQQYDSVMRVLEARATANAATARRNTQAA